MKKLDFFYSQFTKNCPDDLLERCLGSNTQNNNESFNSCVWKLARKVVLCGKTVLEIAIFIAGCIFNEGFNTLLKILEVMGVKIGPEAVNFANTHDEQRVAAAIHHSSKTSKEGRLARREARAVNDDLFEEVEGILYAAGITDYG